MSLLSNVTASEYLLVLSFFAGAVHIVAPDHWMPFSLLAWKRRWGGYSSFLLSLVMLSSHLALGFGIYLAIRPLILLWDGPLLFNASVGMVVLAMLFRATRLKKIDEILLQKHNRGLGSVILFLGPCESVIPIMIKSHHLGLGYLAPLTAFFVGTLVVGAMLMTLTRSYWDQPLQLTRGVAWANEMRSVLPILIGLTAGVAFILRL